MYPPRGAAKPADGNTVIPDIVNHDEEVQSESQRQWESLQALRAGLVSANADSDHARRINGYITNLERTMTISSLAAASAELREKDLSSAPQEQQQLYARSISLLENRIKEIVVSPLSQAKDRETQVLTIPSPGALSLPPIPTPQAHEHVAQQAQKVNVSLTITHTDARGIPLPDTDHRVLATRVKLPSGGGVAS